MDDAPPTDVTGLWRDPVARALLTADQLDDLPEHPAGSIELRGIPPQFDESDSRC